MPIYQFNDDGTTTVKTWDEGKIDADLQEVATRPFIIRMATLLCESYPATVGELLPFLMMMLQFVEHEDNGVEYGFRYHNRLPLDVMSALTVYYSEVLHKNPENHQWERSQITLEFCYQTTKAKCQELLRRGELEYQP